MGNNSRSVPHAPSGGGMGSAAAEPPAFLANLVYRSRAVSPLSASELHQLAVTSQGRNRSESVTGLMLYDEGHFFQWLEGPADGVDRVMGSIRKDSRHTDLEMLDRGTAQSRRFVGWDMKLAARGPKTAPWREEVLEPPREVIEDLRKRPEAAPVVLAKLMPIEAALGAKAEAGSDAPLGARTAAVLRSVMIATVIPALAAGRRAPPNLRRAFHNRAPELAELLLAPGQNGALELILELQDGVPGPQPLYSDLFEPAARRLGDLWSDDDCTEADVTLGLARLQMAARLIAASAPLRARSALRQPAVLVVPEPGEIHGLGATLDSEVLRGAGWSPLSEHPADDDALQDTLAEVWVDALDLSLSAAFRREHKLAEMARTIADARRASRNPALIVVVGGRVFVEEQSALAQVGADAASVTSADVDRLILRSVLKAGWTSAAGAG